MHAGLPRRGASLAPSPARPFRPRDGVAVSHPGRCPGLRQGGPFGPQTDLMPATRSRVGGCLESGIPSKIHCRDAPWGVSETERAVRSATTRPRASSRATVSLWRRPTRRLYSGALFRDTLFRALALKQSPASGLTARADLAQPNGLGHGRPTPPLRAPT